MTRHDRPALAPAPTTALAMLLALAAVAQACGPNADPSDGERAGSTAEGRTATAEPGEWIALFDGTDLRHWRGYRRDDPPADWRVRDRMLVFEPGDDGGDLITREMYGDFELELEWRVGPAGNSGVFYRAGEETPAIWHDAPEMQILDDAGHPDGGDPTTSAGSNYALHPPAEDVTRPAGEWNQARIVARGPHVEHWLNGRKIVEYELWSDDWEDRVRRSKFVDYPGYGRHARGHVGLQDHGDTIWFRDIRIRTPAGPSGGAHDATP